MSFYLVTFAYLLIISSSFQLYQFFSAMGAVQSAGEIFNSNSLPYLYALLTGLGLLMHKPLARLSAIGICIFGVIAPIVWAIYVSLHIREYMMAFAFVLVFFQNLPVFLNNMYGYLALGIFATLFSSVLFGIALSQLNSDDAKEFYGNSEWLGLDISILDKDLRPLIMAFVFLGCVYFDKLTTAQFKQEMEQKQFANATKVLNQELEKDPTYLKNKQAQEEAQRKAKDDSKQLSFLSFTNDEQKLWAVALDGKIHLIDLLKYTVKTFDFGRFHQGRINHLSRLGLYFYNSDKNVFVETQTGAEIDLKTKYKTILGFANPDHHVLLYDTTEKRIILFDIKNKQELWAKTWVDTSSSPFLNGVFWSSDLKTILLGPPGSYYLLNTENGHYEKMAVKFRYPEFVSSSKKTNQMVISGPADFSQNNYKTYLVDTTNRHWSELNTSNAIIDFDPIAKVLVTKQQQSLKLLNLNLPSSVTKEIKIQYSTQFKLGRGQNWIMLPEERQTKVQFINLATEQKINAGYAYAADRPIETSVSKLAVAESGQLFAFSNRQKLEIFWTSEFTKPTPKSWVLDLNIAESRRR